MNNIGVSKGLIVQSLSNFSRNNLSASRLVVWTQTSISLRDNPSLDGDASETQRVYTGSGLECPTSSGIGGLYILAPKGACTRGVQAGCERGLSPRPRLCGGQSAGRCSVNE